jgi:PAS domain S-box-containing protein
MPQSSNLMPATAESNLRLRMARSPLLRYAIGVTSVAIALGLALFAQNLHFGNVEVPLFLFAVAVTAWYAGPGPATFSVLLSIVLFDYFFVPPLFSFSVNVLQIPYFFVFIAFAWLVAWFSAVRRRVERELLLARDHLQAEVAERTQQASLLNLTHDSIFVRDMDHIITYWNAGAQELYGWAAGDALGKNAQELLQTVFPLSIEVIRSELLDTGRWQGELRRTTAGGKPVVVSARWSLQRDEKGQPASILETSNDITERKRREEEYRTLNQELAKRSAQLEATNKELEAFAYSISHDLRAPLRHMAGYTELLQKKAASVLDEKSNRYILMVLDSAKRMGNLIDDLLAFSRIGRADTQKSLVSLTQLVKEALSDLRQDTEGRDINWKIGALPDFYGDRSMFRLVFVNLLSNAVKFTRPRAHAEIEIGCANLQGDDAVVFIRDNGVGFDMKYADKLFGVFQRLHAADAFEGTGIGLATVQRIIHRHGGKVWAEGGIDKGATFYFSAPKPQGHLWRRSANSAAS